MENGKVVTGHPNGLSWLVTSLLIVADLGGGGVVAMPVAMVHSGAIAGTVVIVMLSVMFLYSSHLLAENWLILKSRYDIYEQHCRKPYSEMAFQAMGSKARFLCSSIVNTMLFGLSVVYLLLSSLIINELISSFTGENIGFCYMLLILAFAIWPITLLKSPQDFCFYLFNSELTFGNVDFFFRWAILVAMITTLLSVILIIYGAISDYSVCSSSVAQHRFKFDSFIFSLGTFMFGYGGHAVFPTIQHDMKRPQDFTRAAILAFFIVTFMYGPISLIGYLTYGDSLEESIINSIQVSWVKRFADLFIAVHCILTLTLNVNPLNQEVEQLFKLPQAFGWQRVVARTAVMGVVVFVAETIPKFGPLLDIMGGTVIALTSGVLPVLYNLYLNAAEYDLTAKIYVKPSFMKMIKRTPKYRLAVGVFIVVVTAVCGVSTTYRAVIDITSTHFTTPCYLASSEGIKPVTVDGSLHCCGTYRNISRFNDTVCFSSV